MSEIFISYKREERDKARSIAEALVSRGYKVWWDIELLPGDRFADEIKAVIQHAKVAIVLWSGASVASDFVRAEASLAQNLGILVPIRIDDCELPLPFNTYHTLDLHDWDGESDDEKLSPLLLSVEKRIGPRVAAEDTAEIEKILFQPKGEVDYWKSINDRESQNIEEYASYIEKYGKDGIFYELAIIRIKVINEGGDNADKEKQHWNKAAAMATVAGAIIAGISLYLTVYNSDKPDIELCDEPIYETVADEKLCGTTIEKYTETPPQPKTCRHKDFGQVGWTQIKSFTGSSGWRSGGSNQKEWCDQFIARTIGSLGLNSKSKTEVVASSEDDRWTGLRHREYNYSCTIKVSWEPLYAEKTDSRCGMLPAVIGERKVAATCQKQVGTRKVECGA